MVAGAATSDFDIARMPREAIVPRRLHPWSVHHSLHRQCWIATLSLPEAGSGGGDSAATRKLRYQQFSLPSERAARKFCLAYAPPRMAALSTAEPCRLCRSPAPPRGRGGTAPLRPCRNCGVPVCDRCSCRWAAKMLPRTYHPVAAPPAATARVCRACDWLSNAFCLALLQGRCEDAIQLHATGNVNLRTRFADIHCEAMFPIHCAVLGGSLEAVRWLIETHLCPFAGSPDPATGRAASVQTSARRTLVDLTMTGPPKIRILRYLVQRGLAVDDVRDAALVPKTLTLLLRDDGGGGMDPTDADFPMTDVPEIDVVESCASDSVGAPEDACQLCCERSRSDCVLQPCGHQICCAECAGMLQLCPVCKQPCSLMRIYRP